MDEKKKIDPGVPPTSSLYPLALDIAHLKQRVEKLEREVFNPRAAAAEAGEASETDAALPSPG